MSRCPTFKNTGKVNEHQKQSFIGEFRNTIYGKICAIPVTAFVY